MGSPGVSRGSTHEEAKEVQNAYVSEICHDDGKEDWIGCDNCEQHFHASCAKVDFARSLANYFASP